MTTTASTFLPTWTLPGWDVETQTYDPYYRTPEEYEEWYRPYYEKWLSTWGPGTTYNLNSWMGADLTKGADYYIDDYTKRYYEAKPEAAPPPPPPATTTAPPPTTTNTATNTAANTQEQEQAQVTSPYAGYIYNPEMDLYTGVNDDFFSTDNDKFNTYITNIVKKAQEENAPQSVIDFYTAIEPILETGTAQLEGNFILNPDTGEWFRYGNNFFNPNSAGYDVRDFFNDMKENYATAEDYLGLYDQSGWDEGQLQNYIDFLTGTTYADAVSSGQMQDFFTNIGGTRDALDLYNYSTADPAVALQALKDAGLYSTSIDQNRIENLLYGIESGTYSADDYQFLGKDNQAILDAILAQDPDTAYYSGGIGTAIPKEVLDAWKFIDPTTQRGMADWFELLGMDTSYMDPIADLATYEGRRAAGLTGGYPYLEAMQVGTGKQYGGGSAASIRAPLSGAANQYDKNDPFFKNNPDYVWDAFAGDISWDDDSWAVSASGAWIPKAEPLKGQAGFDARISQIAESMNYNIQQTGWGGDGDDFSLADAIFNPNYRTDDYYDSYNWNWGGDQRVYDPNIGAGNWRGYFDNDELLPQVLAMFGDVEGRNWREPSPYWYQGLRDLWTSGQISTNEYLNLRKGNLSNESYIGALDTIRDMLNYGREQGWSATTTDDFMMLPAEAYDYFFNTLGTIDPEWAGLTLGELSQYENNDYGLRVNTEDPVFNDDFTLEDLLAMNFGAPAGWVPDTVNRADVVGSSPLYDSRQRISHGDARDADDYMRDFGLHPEHWTGAARQTIPLITGEQLENNTYNWHEGPIFLPFYQGGGSDYDRKTMANQESAGYWRQYGFSTPKAYFDALSKYGIEVQLPENVAYAEGEYPGRHSTYQKGSKNPNMGWVLPGGITQLKQIADDTVGQTAVNKLDIGSYEDHDGGFNIFDVLGPIATLAGFVFPGLPSIPLKVLSGISAIGSGNPLGAIMTGLDGFGILDDITQSIGSSLGIESMGWGDNFLDDNWGGLDFGDVAFSDAVYNNITGSGIGTLLSAVTGLPTEGPIANLAGSLAGGALHELLPDSVPLSADMNFTQLADKLVTSAVAGADIDLLPLIGQAVSGLIPGQAGQFLGPVVTAILQNMDDEDIYDPVIRAAYEAQGSTPPSDSGGTGNSGTQTGGNGSTINNIFGLLARFNATGTTGSSELDRELLDYLVQQRRRS